MTAASRRAHRGFDDAWGAAARAAFGGDPKAGRVVMERDDGLVDPIDIGLLFAEPPEWPPHERAALRYARGRVLDVGCGAGRHALELQRRGLEVLAIDTSPAMLAVARERGVRRVRRLGLADVSPALGLFDTVLLLGHNFGLLESAARAPGHLHRLAAVTTERARIIATTRDPHQTRRADHLRYHRRNRSRGRLSGQIRMRSRYRTLVDPWFDYLFVSPREMTAVLRGTGWSVRRSFGAARPEYAVVIEKTGRSA